MQGSSDKDMSTNIQLKSGLSRSGPKPSLDASKGNSHTIPAPVKRIHAAIRMGDFRLKQKVFGILTLFPCVLNIFLSHVFLFLIFSFQMVTRINNLSKMAPREATRSLQRSMSIVSLSVPPPPPPPHTGFIIPNCPTARENMFDRSNKCIHGLPRSFLDEVSNSIQQSHTSGQKKKKNCQLWKKWGSGNSSPPPPHSSTQRFSYIFSLDPFLFLLLLIGNRNSFKPIVYHFEKPSVKEKEKK